MRDELRHAVRATRARDIAQSEGAFGPVPGGGAQHLVRLMGRGRALEMMLSASDFDA